MLAIRLEAEETPGYGDFTCSSVISHSARVFVGGIEIQAITQLSRFRFNAKRQLNKALKVQKILWLDDVGVASDYDALTSFEIVEGSDSGPCNTSWPYYALLVSHPHMPPNSGIRFTTMRGAKRWARRMFGDIVWDSCKGTVQR